MYRAIFVGTGLWFQRGPNLAWVLRKGAFNMFASGKPNFMVRRGM